LRRGSRLRRGGDTLLEQHTAEVTVTVGPAVIRGRHCAQAFGHRQNARAPFTVEVDRASIRIDASRTNRAQVSRVQQQVSRPGSGDQGAGEEPDDEIQDGLALQPHDRSCESPKWDAEQESDLEGVRGNPNIRWLAQARPLDSHATAERPSWFTLRGRFVQDATASAVARPNPTPVGPFPTRASPW